MKYEVALIVVILAIVSACNATPKSQGEIVTAKFSEHKIASGSSTELIMDARNSGQADGNYKFVIVAEGVAENLVTLDPGTEFSFVLRPQETTGEKRVKITAISNTISTDFEFKVQWQDSEGRILEEKQIVLTVSKQVQKTGGGIFGTAKDASP